jgi:parallel beta-helix repeat protein
MKSGIATFAAVLSLWLSAVAHAVVLNPTADSHVRDGSSANTNFGTAAVLEVRTASGQNRDAYLKFDLTGMSGITDVKLRINAALSGNGSVATSAYSVPTTTWTETGITWNNRPALGSQLSTATVSGTSNAWYELDVTAYVQSEVAAGRPVISLGLHAASSNRIVNVKSRESATNKPELVVTVTSGNTPTPTPTPTPTNTPTPTPTPTSTPVGNTPPTVDITSPVDGATFPQPANITINATAADSDGTVTKVEFFQGATKIGEDSTAPYSLAWSDVLAAAYSLTARATDNGSAVTTSTAVGVTVTEGGPTNVSGAISANTTWTLSASPYVVTANVSVGGASSPVLTIEPGVAVKFNSGTTLIVGYGGSPGGLQAVGISSRQITFTANTASPTAGFWKGIQLYSGTTSTSRIAYAIVSYAGEPGGYRGGIAVENCSPTIENTTVQTNSYAGITLRVGGSPVVRNSTITGNSGDGIIASEGSSPTLDTLTVTNNSAFPVSTHAKVTFASISGLTLTGNGTNAVALWQGDYQYVDVNTTWKNPGVPYVVTHDVDLRKTGSITPILTIEPGTTLKFNSGRTLFVGLGSPADLQAVGTAAQPITFTANTGSPTPGFWKGIQFNSGTTSTSRIAYAIVSYAGVTSNTGGIHVAGASGASPILDHVRFISNAYAGLSLNVASPIVQSSDFTSNTAGLVNQTPTTIADARLNWWNAPTGPSGSGGGTGQSISSGVRFDPWLTAPGSAPQFFNAFFLGNSIFNPTQGIHATFNFSSSLTGNWRVIVYNSENVLLRTLTGSGVSGAPNWDGKNEAGVAQPDGSYRYELESTTAASESAAPLRGYAVLDSTRQLAIGSPAIAPAFFSPNADTIQDSTTVTASSNFDGATWTLNVKNSGGATVRSATGPAIASISYSWDGKNSSGVVQPDGAYTLELVLVDGNATVSANLFVTLDVTFPTAVVTYPGGSEFLSNVYQSGQTDLPVTGTSSDTNLNNWTLDYGAGAAPATWTTVTTGTLPVVNSTLASWSTLAIANGLYTLRLRVWDKAGNLSAQSRNPSIGNFSVSQSTLSFNSGSGGTVTYTSVVPFTLTETLVVKDSEGQIVRTLVSAAQRATGSFADAWNGRDGAGNLLPDGPYFYSATITDGTYSLAWDLSNQYLNDMNFVAPNDNETYNFEPFHNGLLPIPSFPGGLGPGRAWVLFSTTFSAEIQNGTATPEMCGIPGNFCQPAGEYQPPGRTFTPWAGVDPSGVFRTDILGLATIVNRATFPRNAVVSFGTRPTLISLVVAPTYYRPPVVQQAVSFFLTSYQSQPVTVRLTVTNLASRSVLRTKTVTGVVPGMASISWDGRADNGMWVAAGRYSLDLLVTDAIGNSANAQTLTVVDY